jgi:hypothetical protein
MCANRNNVDAQLQNMQVCGCGVTYYSCTAQPAHAHLLG